MDKYILLLALETLEEQVLDAIHDKHTEEGIKISAQHLARIRKQKQLLWDTTQTTHKNYKTS